MLDCGIVGMQVYIAGHSSPAKNMELLDHMIECR
jgi:hypothetical protein